MQITVLRDTFTDQSVTSEIASTFIYALCDPATGEARYIGKSNDPVDRLREHIRTAKYDRTMKANWIRSLLSKNSRPIVEVLAEVPEEQWMQWEQFCISLFSACGCRLLNGDAGGLGRGRTTDELRAKISASGMGKRWPERWRRCAQYDKEGRLVRVYASIKEACKATGALHSNILRAIRGSLTSKGYQWRYADSEPISVIPAHREPNRAHPWSEETRRLLTGRKRSNESRKCMSDSAKIRWRNKNNIAGSLYALLVGRMGGKPRWSGTIST